MDANSLNARISAMAYRGLSPYEIEEKLGMEHYTIHIHHHADLMAGYAAIPDKKPDPSKTTEEIEERRRQYQREYWKNNKRRLRECKRQLRIEKKQREQGKTGNSESREKMKFKRKLQKEFIVALEQEIELDESLDALEKKQILKYAVSQFEMAANGDIAKSCCSICLAASRGKDFFNKLYYVLDLPTASKTSIGAEISHNFEFVTLEDQS